MREHEHLPDGPAPRRAPRMAATAPRSVLDLQRTAGNRAVNEALAVQRVYTGTHSVQYGPLWNGSGTEMHAELHPKKVTEGTVPSTVPPWWPAPGTPARAWTAGHLVQGHLLNHNIGGPGNTMSNLTPLTRSANGQHHGKVEKTVKKALLEHGHVVEYNVKADYTGHPSAAQIGAPPGVAKAVTPTMAKGIAAEYTIYVNGKDKGGDRWEITNETSAFK
ncbi:DNA/RNA non-specific endonuclease [Phytomonospora sp. NPDC050363]|uniref:DNA/RNA non-specific endonuclease n=1 Tax=Phytomonospora sp. NPDC050363 TaxID=3155642 RepID=UPI0033F094D8